MLCCVIAPVPRRGTNLFRRACRPLPQYILENYAPLHPDLRKLTDAHFDPEFLAGFRAGRPVLTEVHPYVFVLK